MALDLRYKTRSWSLSNQRAPGAGAGGAPASTARKGSAGNRSHRSSSIGLGGSPRSSPHTTHTAYSSPTHRFQYGRRTRGVSSFSLDSSLDDQPASCVDRCLSCVFCVVLLNVPFFDDDWRAARRLPPLVHLWNFWVAAAGLLCLVLGITALGLSYIGQYPVVDLPDLYAERTCTVHGGNIVQYSLEGYVDTHWVPLRVSVLEAPNSSSVSSSSLPPAPSSSSSGGGGQDGGEPRGPVANVTGVSGGWIWLDRFPMPPLNGRITAVPDHESIFSNDVAVSVDLAVAFLDGLVGAELPCLVPKDARVLDAGARDASSSSSYGDDDYCSPGLYPYAWAMGDLEKTGSFQASTCYAQPVLVPDDDARGNEAAHDTNAGSNFACKGRIVFVNATFADNVEPIAAGFWTVVVLGFSSMAVWPLVCLAGQIHGACWTYCHGSVDPVGHNGARGRVRSLSLQHTNNPAVGIVQGEHVYNNNDGGGDDNKGLGVASRAASATRRGLGAIASRASSLASAARSNRSSESEKDTEMVEQTNSERHAL